MVTVAPGLHAPDTQASAPGIRHSRWPVRIAVTLGVLGVAYRVAMLLADMPRTNSDEATMGLAALHMAEGHRPPIWFYGQYYMGTLEAMLAAPLFVVFGASTLVLRLPLLPLYVVFLVAMWRLTSRLYTPWLAVFTVGLLALGSDRVLKNELIALGGYPEMNPAGALLMLLAVNLGLGVVRRRALAYGVWGFLAGLMLWDDWLLLPYIGAAGLLLLVAPAGRRPTWRHIGALVAGAVVGAAPLLWHNLTSPWSQNSLQVMLALNSGPDGRPFAARFDGAILLGLPMTSGLCPPADCGTWQVWWGWAYPVLLVAAGLMACWGIYRAIARRQARQRSVEPAGAPASTGPASGTAPGPDAGRGPEADTGRQVGANRDEWFRHCGRLALVVGAALTILAYLDKGAAAATPVESSRYLSCLLISTPAVLWPLWSLARRGRSERTGSERARSKRVLPLSVAATVPLAVLLATSVWATGAAVAYVPETHRLADQRRELVGELRRLGVTHFYAEYWTCNLFAFASREDAVCAVIRDSLRRGLDRYKPYRRQVSAAPRPAFVVPSGSPLSAAVAARLRVIDPAATMTTAGGYDIYQPTRRLVPPLKK